MRSFSSSGPMALDPVKRKSSGSWDCHRQQSPCCEILQFRRLTVPMHSLSASLRVSSISGSMSFAGL
jgi:hypothetical protein